MDFIVLIGFAVALAGYNWAPHPWRSTESNDPTLPGPVAHNPGEFIFCLVMIILLAYAGSHFLGHSPA